MAHTIDLDAYHLVDFFRGLQAQFLQDLGRRKTYSAKNIIPDPKGTIFFIPRLGLGC